MKLRSVAVLLCKIEISLHPLIAIARFHIPKKGLLRFVFKVLRSGLLRYILYTGPNLCYTVLLRTTKYYTVLLRTTKYSCTFTVLPFYPFYSFYPFTILPFYPLTARLGRLDLLPFYPFTLVRCALVSENHRKQKAHGEPPQYRMLVYFLHACYMFLVFDFSDLYVFMYVCFLIFA